MKQFFYFFIGVTMLSGLFLCSAFGQTATSFEFKNAQRNPGGFLLSGELYITVGGKEIKLTDKAVEAWILDGGKSVVYSGRDGAGFADSRGQSLRIYEVVTGKTIKIMAERADVLGLSEVKLNSGETALLVRLEDGGSGTPYAVVVDRKRGEVLRRSGAEFSEIKGDTAKIVYYQSNDWETIFQPRAGKDNKNKTAIPMKVKAKIKKTETLDLKKIIKMKVIVVK